MIVFVTFSSDFGISDVRGAWLGFPNLMLNFLQTYILNRKKNSVYLEIWLLFHLLGRLLPFHLLPKQGGWQTPLRLCRIVYLYSMNLCLND